MLRSVKVLAVLALGVLVLALSGQAQAHTVIAPGSGTSYPYQRWVDESLVPTPDVTVTVREGLPADAPTAGCDGEVLGCTDRTSWVFVALTSHKMVAHETFLHELGHIYGGESEAFAESYALCGRFGLTAGRERLTPLGFRPTCKLLLSQRLDSWRGGRPAR